MRVYDESTNRKPEPSYFAACYASKRFQEIIFSVRRVEFADQLCEREPVIVLALETTPRIVGLTVMAILAESNKQSAKDNPWLLASLSDISQGRVFYNRNEYATFQIGEYSKRDNIGKGYYDTPGYQASHATIINDFNQHYSHLLVEATDKTILVSAPWSKRNPIQFSEEIPLSAKNEEIGVLFLGFSRFCI